MAEYQTQQVYAAESSTSTSIVCPPPYVTTLPGILRIAEIILSILTFACSLGAEGSDWAGRGSGWVTFVGVSAMIFAVIWLVFHCVNLFQRIPFNIIMELVLTAIWCVLFLIAGIVAAAIAGKYNESGDGAMGAAAFFAFASFIVMGIDAFFQFRNSDITVQFSSNRETTTTTTTTTSTSGDTYAKEDVGHY